LQDKRAEIAFFDQFAAEAEYDVFDDHGYARLLREFSRLVRPVGGETLLDVGCGSGAFSARLARFGLRLAGLDISYKIVHFATAHLPGAFFLVGDAETLPFGDGRFDIVTFSGILHHLPGLQKAIAESYRVLKPGGRLFAYDPNGRNPAMWLYRNPRSPFSSRKGWTVNERLLPSEEVELSLAENGFCNVTTAAISGVTYKYVKSPLLKRLLFFYNFLDSCLDQTGFSRRFGAFLLSYGTKPKDAK
jgi:ubiquinone/menaquinone biosynthesis C-methylase UbiE